MLGELSYNLKIKSRKTIKNIEIKLNKTDYVKKVKYNKIESLYLRQYKKYFHKKLSIKYNVLPKEYILIQLENFVRAKYCHSLAKFKEDLLFNYEQEFLNKYYNKKDSIKKLPLFSEFYKTYLAFFCRPTLSELNLNELIEEMVERKAKDFYQENYQEETKEKKSSKKIINTIFFTNKVRKDISRKNTLTDLSKTTIDYMTTTNKNSINSFISINNLIKEIKGGDNNKNNNLINRNAMTSRQINNLNKNERIKKIIKNLEINSKYKINPNLIKKRNILKNSSKSIISQQEKKPFINKKIKEIKEVKEIKAKSINNTNNNNNTQMNSINKNMIINNTEASINRNRESNNNNISKPLYHKINIVNNKIIIINNNRSKGNILKVSKEKLRSKKKNITSRNYNKNNFFSTYHNNTISKDRTLNNHNCNTKSYLLKTFKDHSHKKEQSTKNYNSLQAKSDNKLKHIKIIKEKNSNTNKLKTSIQSYNNKKMDSNLLANYINNYKKINNRNNNINKNNNLYNTNILRKKKLTNYQLFSNNININQTQKLSNKSKEILSPLYKMINSTCSVGTINKNKVNSILKINAYNTLENLPKSKYSNIYRKQCSNQEKYKTKLQINNNSLNKNILSLKLTKK